MELNDIRIELHQMRESIAGKQVDNLNHIKSLPYLSLVQSVQGSYRIAIDDGDFFQTNSRGFFIAPAQAKQNIFHHTDANGTMHMRWIFLDILINESYPIDSLYDFPVVLPQNKKEALNLLFDRLFAAKHICDRMSICYEIVKLLLSVATEKPFKPKKELLDVLDYIKQNYRTSIRISDMAKVAKMSDSNFHSLFRKHFNTSPIAYLNDYRLMIASGLLKNTQDRIGTIAEQVGIPDQLYFSKLFKKKYAVSPKMYRKNKEY